MSESRQVRWQRLKVAQGLCHACGKPAYKGGTRCYSCLGRNGRYIKPGKYLDRREKWKTVNYSLPVAQLAKQMGVTIQAVYYHKRKALAGMR